MTMCNGGLTESIALEAATNPPPSQLKEIAEKAVGVTIDKRHPIYFATVDAVVRAMEEATIELQRQINETQQLYTSETRYLRRKLEDAKSDNARLVELMNNDKPNEL